MQIAEFLVLCLVLLGASFALARWLAQRAQSGPEFAAGQACIYLGLAAATFIGLVSEYPDWRLHLPVSLTTFYVASATGWVAISLFAWSRRIGWEVQPVKAGLRIVHLGLVVLVSLFVIATATVFLVVRTKEPAIADHGRITDELSYEVDLTEYGFGARGFEFAVYRTRPWLPLIRQRVAGGIIASAVTSCPLDADYKSPHVWQPEAFTFAPAPSHDTLLLTCRHQKDGETVSVTNTIKLQ